MEYKYTWEEFDLDVAQMEEFILDNNFRSFLGIGFGGLPLTTALKNKYKIPTQVLVAQSYNNRDREESVILDFAQIEVPLGPVLIIDDIADTGHTLKKVTNFMNAFEIEYKVVTLFYKEQSIVKPDYSSNKAIEDSWVIFPWE